MHLNETQLNDFVDEAVNGVERDAILQHLAVCALCRDEVGGQGSDQQGSWRGSGERRTVCGPASVARRRVGEAWSRAGVIAGRTTP